MAGGWVSNGNGWQISSNTALPNASNTIVLANASFSGRFKLTMDVLTTSATGFVFGYVNDSECSQCFYRVYAQSGTITMDQVIGGVSGTLYAYSSATAPSAPFTLVVEGDAASHVTGAAVYANGNLLFLHTNVPIEGYGSPRPTTGGIGMIGSGAVDNFKLER